MSKVLDFNSEHFSLYSIADGVFAAIHQEGGAAIGNAGLIDLGGQILVFDTFLTPQAASTLRQFSLETFNQIPQWVVNSHYHNDHIWGNQVFAQEANIISSSLTNALFDTLGDEEYRWYAAHAAHRLNEIQKKVQEQSQGPALNIMLGYYTGLVEALPSLKVVKPNISFESQLSLYGHKRSAELIAFEGGHTKSDTVLYLPQDKVLFMSDLLFVEAHPFLSEGDPVVLVDTLNKLIQFDADVYIPGHGPIGGKADMQAMIAYVEDCLDAVNGMIKLGVDPEQIAGIEVPQKYSGWVCPHFYPENLKSIYERLKAT